MKEIEQNREGHELFRALHDLMDKASRDYQSHEGNAAERLDRRIKAVADLREELNLKNATLYELQYQLERERGKG